MKHLDLIIYTSTFKIITLAGIYSSRRNQENWENESRHKKTYPKYIFKSKRMPYVVANTETCEQFNSYLQRLKWTCTHLCQERFCFLLQYAIYKWNIKKTNQENWENESRHRKHIHLMCVVFVPIAVNGLTVLAKPAFHRFKIFNEGKVSVYFYDTEINCY